MAENKVAADAKAFDLAQVASQTANECFAALLTEGLVEMNEEQRVRPQRFNHPQLLRQRINQRRHAAGRDDGAWMPVKRDDQRGGIMLACVRDGSSG